MELTLLQLVSAAAVFFRRRLDASCLQLTSCQQEKVRPKVRPEQGAPLVRRVVLAIVSSCPPIRHRHS